MKEGPRCRCGHNWIGHRIAAPHPCKTCPRCASWQVDRERERRIRDGQNH